MNSPSQHLFNKADFQGGSAEEVDKKVRAVELWISNLLRGGVGLSLLLLVMGTILTFVHHPDYQGDASSLRVLTSPGAAFPHSVSQMLASLHRGRGQAIVTLGLLVLIATPVLRVAVSVLAFWHQRDRAFTIITLAVLGLLLLSLLLGHAGG